MVVVKLGSATFVNIKDFIISNINPQNDFREYFFFVNFISI